MKLEDQVVSLDLSKKLKELGVKQESHFSWFSVKSDREKDCYVSCDDGGYGYRVCSAFTTSEMGEMIGNSVNEWAQGWDDCGCFWRFSYGNRGAGTFIDGIGKRFSYPDPCSEADARARLLICLIEKGAGKP